MHHLWSKLNNNGFFSTTQEEIIKPEDKCMQRIYVEYFKKGPERHNVI